MPKQSKHPRLSCEEFWRLILDLLRLKHACYISTIELGNFKKSRFRPNQYHPRGMDSFDCTKRFHQEGIILRYHVGRFVWLVLPNKRCIDAFERDFPDAKLETK